MSDLNTITPSDDRALHAETGSHAHQDPKQRKLMLGSLCLLLVALGIVIWRNSDFWFPDNAPEAESDQPVEGSPAAKAAPVQPSAATAKSAVAAKPKHRVASAAKASAAKAAAAQTSPAPQTPAAASSSPAATTTTRTVLPPVEMEVVAGDTHRTIRPGSSSVRVSLQPGAPAQPVSDAGATGDTPTAAKVINDAAERMQITTNASEIVTSPVRPNYPLLARQMKVEGSVILVALIGKDGIIQNLRVISGPRILAGAAEDAVRQWKFKPHVEGGEAVETQAKITVNFTISTN
jgi:TonB family protein